MQRTGISSASSARLSFTGLLELLKPITWFPPMWAFLCGAISAGTGITDHLWLLLAGIVLTGPLVCGASQIINDWCDRDVDALNEPHRPIPSGRVPAMTALVFAWLWSTLAMTWGAALGTTVAVATGAALILAWAYSAPPLRLKRNGWWGNSAVAISYEGLAWVTGAALFLDGQLPGAAILSLAALYSVGAHGIMTLNDFKSIQGDRVMGLRSLPAMLGALPAAKLACAVMLIPQLVVIALLYHWQAPWFAAAIVALVIAQCLAMMRLLQDPERFAPWYNGTGVTAYVAGMMIAASALASIAGTTP